MSIVRLALASLLVLGGATAGHAACDVGGTDAAAIAAARAAIDAACPCAAAQSRATYQRCAMDAVRGRIVAGQLPPACRRELSHGVKFSVCGRPGAVVCCRLVHAGRRRDGVVASRASCTSSSRVTACVSGWPDVERGCDPTGCVPFCGDGVISGTETCDPPDGSTCDASYHFIPPLCGNGVLDPGEECDPPDYVICSNTCQRRTCDPPPTSCGNGVLDTGETCEPPGVGNCGSDCQPAGCANPAPGELAIACVPQPTAVSVAATPDRYLVGWAAPHRQTSEDVLVRRYAPDGTPIDAGVTVVSAGSPCGATSEDPSLASDGSGFYAVWSGYGSASGGFFFDAFYGRQIDAAAGLGSLDTLSLEFPFGMCRESAAEPTMAAGVSSLRFAVGWLRVGYCYPQGIIYEDPVGEIVDLNPPPTRQGAGIGYSPFMPPGVYSATPATVASLGGAALWAWQATAAASVTPPFVSFVAAGWSDGAGNTGPFTLTGRTAHVEARPSVAAGAASLLVAWGQGATDTAATVTEIRAVRATRAANSLDPDGGLLLASAGTRVTAGPVAAYDGARWLVVWAEAAGAGTNDLRAVAVGGDGSVVDASPRLVASNVAAREPAAASVGDGRVLVLFVRPDGGRSAVRGTLVTP